LILHVIPRVYLTYLNYIPPLDGEDFDINNPTYQNESITSIIFSYNYRTSN